MLEDIKLALKARDMHAVELQKKLSLLGAAQTDLDAELSEKSKLLDDQEIIIAELRQKLKRLERSEGLLRSDLETERERITEAEGELQRLQEALKSSELASKQNVRIFRMTLIKWLRVF